MSEQVDYDEVKIIAVASRLLIRKILIDLNIVCDVSDKIVAEMSTYFLRDLNRLREQQKEKVSSIKFAGYWGFWLRKLKPISNAFIRGSDRNNPRNEVAHINELVALEISISYILKIAGISDTGGSITDPIRGACSKHLSKECDGSECVKKSAYDFLRFQNAGNLKYLIYSMRHRTFGPHHFVTNLDHMVFGACRAAGGLA